MNNKGKPSPPKPPYPHLGKLIDHRLTELGMSKAEFGRRIITSRQNVGMIIEKHTLSSEQLWKIGDVLDVNFFEVLADCFRRRTKRGGQIDDHWVEICIRVHEDKLARAFRIYDQKVAELRQLLGEEE